MPATQTTIGSLGCPHVPSLVCARVSAIANITVTRPACDLRCRFRLPLAVRRLGGTPGSEAERGTAAHSLGRIQASSLANACVCIPIGDMHGDRPCAS